MLFKSRDKPSEMIYYELLEYRMPFSKEEKHNYFNVKKDYEGETLFNRSSQNYMDTFAVCNDLLLKTNNILFQVGSLKFLFPKEMITTNLVAGWCKLNLEKRRIRRILEKSFIKKGVRQWTYYE